jgi:prophage maintenance system killer protein
MQFDGVDAVKMMESLAAGTMDEQAVADWLRARIRPA